MSTMTYETARSLPKGAYQISAGVAGGHTRGALATYKRPSSPPDEPPENYAPDSVQTDLLAIKGAYGLGGGWQAYAGLNFIAFGVVAGMKYQFVGDFDSPFALALLIQGHFGWGGFSLEKMVVCDGQLALPVGIRLAGKHELTLSPRVVRGYFYRTDPYHTGDLDVYEEMDAAVWAYGGSLSYGYKVGDHDFLVFEVSLLNIPRQAGNPEGGLVVLGGVSIPFNLFADDDE
jgi:hypothetical protein